MISILGRIRRNVIGSIGYTPFPAKNIPMKMGIKVHDVTRKEVLICTAQNGYLVWDTFSKEPEKPDPEMDKLMQTIKEECDLRYGKNK